MRIQALGQATSFFARLPFAMRNTVGEAEARQSVSHLLARRGDLLLHRIRQDVFGCPGSVYERLFHHVGVEMGDVETLVRREGVEDALKRLLHGGVYLTVDEFKGRAEVVRGSLRLAAGPSRLRSPRAGAHFSASSGGSRAEAGRGGTPLLFDMQFVRDCGAAALLNLHCWGGSDWKKAVWESPLVGGRFRQLKLSMFGDPVAANFSQIDLADPSLGRVFHWNRATMRFLSKLAGRPLPDASYVSPADPTPIAEWLAGEVRRGHTPYLFTFAGSAVSVCLAAANRGLDISGSVISMAGEPVTEARIAAVRKVGAVPMPRYGSIETGAMAYGCPNPVAADDCHVMLHLHALIHYGAGAGSPGAAGLPEKALLLTALHPRSPYLMINVSMGDQAEMGARDCGCLHHTLGFTTHMSEIRSFEKLTGMGVTFLGTEVIRILEQALPARFGGAPTQYQLVEDEDSNGKPVLWLLMHPAIGPADEARVADAFLDLLGATSPGARVMTQRWKDSGTLRVARRPPQVTAAGKILYLRSGANRRAPGDEVG